MPTQAKVTENTTEKTIKTDFCKAIAERRNRTIQIEKAKAYSNKLKRKRIAMIKKIKKIVKKIIKGIAIVILGVVLLMESGIIGNFKRCKIVEINGDTVTVEHKGELYAFYGDGYVVGKTIICKFTKDMELVGIVE